MGRTFRNKVYVEFHGSHSGLKPRRWGKLQNRRQNRLALKIDTMSAIQLEKEEWNGGDSAWRGNANIIKSRKRSKWGNGNGRRTYNSRTHTNKPNMGYARNTSCTFDEFINFMATDPSANLDMHKANLTVEFIRSLIQTHPTIEGKHILKQLNRRGSVGVFEGYNSQRKLKLLEDEENVFSSDIDKLFENEEQMYYDDYSFDDDDYSDDLWWWNDAPFYG